VAQEKKLGRGFDELMTGEVNYMSEEVLHLPLGTIAPNRFQPRKEMTGDAFENLKASIARDGILQPIVVRPATNGYELIAGERRWRAAKELGLEVIPAIIRQADDQHALELALIENIQREDLNPIDRATAFKQLMATFDLTQEEAAARVGQERSTIANTLRLLELPKDVQAHVRSGIISMGHAKALLSLRSPEQVLDLARRIVEEGLSVRAVESLTSTTPRPGRPRVRKAKAPEVLDLEERLRARLATKVEVSAGKRRGKIVIEYYSSRDLDRILERIGV
jgi:ParB family chromosome partitioning protein